MQCRQGLATTVMFLRSYVAQVLSRGDGPRHSLYTLRRNTVSIMKICDIITPTLLYQLDSVQIYHPRRWTADAADVPGQAKVRSPREGR